MKAKVHTRGWVGDHGIKEGEEATVMLNGVLEIDGHPIIDVTSIEVRSGGGDFTTITAVFLPASVEYIVHTEESWRQLTDDLDLVIT